MSERWLDFNSYQPLGALSVRECARVRIWVLNEYVCVHVNKHTDASESFYSLTSAYSNFIIWIYSVAPPVDRLLLRSF